MGVLLEGGNGTLLGQKLNFLISAGVQGFEPFHSITAYRVPLDQRHFIMPASFAGSP